MANKVTKQSPPKIAPPKKSSADATVAPDTAFVEDDKQEELNYKGKGGCYTLDEQGRVVPVKEN